MKKKVLGIIPARGGSKGIPGKNIRILGGKPLLAYTIEVANEAGIFDRIVLSTDSREIANVGKELGVEVPFIRPDELAQDDTPMLPVLQHEVRLLSQEDWFPDYICILQPTAPFRLVRDLVRGYDLLLNSECDSVVSVNQVPEHYAPHFVMKIEDGRLSHFLNDGIKVTRRQDVKKAYTRSGCFYFTCTNALMDRNTIYGDDCRPVVINNENAVNLDT
ncbi:acylneuraminate cytidylyltransferase family protein, partial [Oceanospirillaceae bacterium]|nr:acylneuraminate cytidylyltransferase family protein [Oceanospirillaceae bacterium]